MLGPATKLAETSAYSLTYRSQTPITDGLNKRLEEYVASPKCNDASASNMRLWTGDLIGSKESRGSIPTLRVILDAYTFVCSSIQVEGGKLEVDRSNPFEALLAREQPEIFIDARRNHTPNYDWCIDQVAGYIKRVEHEGSYDPTVLVEVQRRLGKIYAAEASGKKPKEKDVNFFSGLVDIEKPARVVDKEFPPKRSISSLVAALR